MALKEYVGAIVLEVDGKEYDIVDFNEDHQTGKKLVKTMNRTGKALGFSRGVETWELTVTAAIPFDDPMDWEAVEGAKFTVYPTSEGGTRESYTDCVCVSAGRKYGVENEARIDLKFLALNRVKE